MVKEFSESLLGIVLSALGILLMYYYLTGLNNGPNYLYLILSLVFLIGAVMLFVHAEKADTIILKRVKPEGKELAVETTEEIGLSKKIQKNNELLEEWKKTNETRDKMKLVELSSQPKT